jgi:enterochelin esterase-like enzyme
VTFTYSPISTDRDRVRFHLGDTDASAPKFSDEEIDAVIVECDGHWKPATLACIRNLIARLSQPDFKADWLQVTSGDAIASWRRLYSEKSAEFGLTSGRSFTSGVTNVTRSDWTGS